MNKLLVVTGTISDGFNMYGPFDDHERAAIWAEQNCDLEWWAVDLVPPEEFDEVGGGA